MTSFLPLVFQSVPGSSSSELHAVGAQIAEKFLVTYELQWYRFYFEESSSGEWDQQAINKWLLYTWRWCSLCNVIATLLSRYRINDSNSNSLIAWNLDRGFSIFNICNKIENKCSTKVSHCSLLFNSTCKHEMQNFSHASLKFYSHCQTCIQTCWLLMHLSYLVYIYLHCCLNNIRIKLSLESSLDSWVLDTSYTTKRDLALWNRKIQLCCWSRVWGFDREAVKIHILRHFYGWCTFFANWLL